MVEVLLAVGVVLMVMAVLVALDSLLGRAQGTPPVWRELVTRGFWAEVKGDWGRLVDSWAQQHRDASSAPRVSP